MIRAFFIEYKMHRMTFHTNSQICDFLLTMDYGQQNFVNLKPT